MAKKKSKVKKHQGLRRNSRPKSFRNFSDCVQYLKKSVYIVARGRKFEINNQEVINWVTLGSGFVVAPNRFLTAAHVINNPNRSLGQHLEGDKYYLLRNDGENVHCTIFEPRIDKEIFLYRDVDIAVIYLDDNFYQIGDKVYADKNDFIPVSEKFLPIGSMVGVLGYPLCKLAFENKDFRRPKVRNVLLRVDKGVINCRYQTSATSYLYDFTMVFNPGNSGGPIFNVETGELISIVRGFKNIKIAEREIIIPDKKLKKLKTYKENAYIEALNATYSFGFATPTFLNVFRDNNII